MEKKMSDGGFTIDFYTTRSCFLFVFFVFLQSGVVCIAVFKICTEETEGLVL